MLVLLDTHLLLWAAYEPSRLSELARATIESAGNTPVYSAASIWEVAIKSALGRADFTADPAVLRRGLQENGYRELEISGMHAVAVRGLPPIHHDPFDRILVAQARTEGMPLLSADPQVIAYGAPVRGV